MALTVSFSTIEFVSTLVKELVARALQHPTHLKMALEESIAPTGEIQDSLFEDTKLISPQPTSGLYNREQSTKAGRLSVSDKKDLTPAQITVVVNLLVNKDSLLYLHENCHMIFQG
jgi:hypothetical protein